MGGRDLLGKGPGVVQMAVEDRNLLNGPDLQDGGYLGAGLGPAADHPQEGRPGAGQVLSRQAARRPGAEIGDMGAVQVGKLQPGIRMVEKDLGHHREQALGRIARVHIDPFEAADVALGQVDLPVHGPEVPLGQGQIRLGGHVHPPFAVGPEGLRRRGQRQVHIQHLHHLGCGQHQAHRSSVSHSKLLTVSYSSFAP